MPTNIDWANESWNVVIGCQKVSCGCGYCYAESMAKRVNQMAARRGDEETWADYSSVLDFDYSRRSEGEPVGWNGNVCCRENQLNKVLHWKKPRRVFVCSMGDLFHRRVPFSFINRVFDRMFEASQHIYQILTKRDKRMKEYITEGLERNLAESGEIISWEERPNDNIWLGVTAESQVCADERVSTLLEIPAGIRFVSFEPFLEPINVEKYLESEKIDWVIVGAERLVGNRFGRFGRGRHKVERFYEAVRWLKRQCEKYGVKLFVKQLPMNGKIVSDMNLFPDDLRVREYPEGEVE